MTSSDPHPLAVSWACPLPIPTRPPPVPCSSLPWFGCPRRQCVLRRSVFPPAPSTFFFFALHRARHSHQAHSNLTAVVRRQERRSTWRCGSNWIWARLSFVPLCVGRPFFYILYFIPSLLASEAIISSLLRISPPPVRLRQFPSLVPPLLSYYFLRRRRLLSSGFSSPSLFLTLFSTSCLSRCPYLTEAIPPS